MSNKLLYQELTGKILEAAFEVANELGIGFLEGVYERSLFVALKEKGIRSEMQVPIKVNFRGVIVGDYFADMLVESKIIIELKAISRIRPEHKAQLINYLKATGFDVGLLLNFGTPRIEYHRLYR